MPDIDSPRRLETSLVGVAGEYFVAAELTLRGHVASITLRNSRGIDILVSSADGERSATIQVKTNKQGKPDWILSEKSENYFSDSHFYAFVALKQFQERPDFHIVPSQKVAEFIANFHREWLSGVKRDGSARKDSNMRRFQDFEGRYKEAWDLLGL